VRGTDIVLTCAARSESQADWQRAWDLVTRSRAVVLEDMVDRHRVSAAVPDPVIAQLDSQLIAATNNLAHLAVQGPGTLPHEHYQGLLQGARRAKEAAERALATRSEPFRLRRAREEVGFRDVAAALPPRSALIAWVSFERLERTVPAGRAQATENPAGDSGEPCYAAFVLGDPVHEVRFVVLGTVEDIDARIALWHREAGSGPLTRGRDAAQQDYLLAGQALRRAIWDPVVTDMQGVERIFLVPDGALALLNFDSLPDDGGGYLLEGAPLLQVLSSERDLILERQEPSSGTGLLTAAAPDYDHTQEPSPGSGPAAGPGGTTRGIPCGQFRSLWFDSLPGTRAEEEEVARLWRKHGARLGLAPSGHHSPEILELVGSAATEQAFKRLSPGRSILHIATHGFFLGAGCMGSRASAGAAGTDEFTQSGLMAESPLLLSGLVFAGANLRDQAPSSDNDGILTAEEIASLNLAGVDCVVLSACETGLGKIEAGEGVFGLRRAFQVAGARSLVMTLWAVDDVATTQWMEAMFEQRLHERRTVTAAVRAASLEILNQRRADGLDTHPFYWGAFVTTGDWR
jgi:CHAT domain-containing protein